jgi:hypothetical protein
MTTNGTVPQPPPADWLDGPLAPDAPADLAALYDGVAAYLRVPFLGPFWRALAWDQPRFASLWQEIRPLLTHRTFEQQAAALRRAALIEEAITMPSHQAFKADMVRAEIDFEMRDRIGNYNAAALYALPKSLLVAAWLLAPPATTERPDDLEGAIPIGIAAGAVAVPPAPPQQIRGRLAELLDEIPRAHQHPIADEYFRAIGRMPDYLNAAWNALKPIVRDEPYDDRARTLVHHAQTAINHLPARSPEAGTILSGSNADRYRAVLTYFSHHHLPDILIDVAIVNGLTVGPDRAQDAPFDYPSPDPSPR